MAISKPYVDKPRAVLHLRLIPARFRQRILMVLTTPSAYLPLAICNVGLAWLLAILLWDSMSHQSLMLWLVLHIVVAAFEVVVRYRVDRHYFTDGHISKAFISILGVDLCVGLLWLYAAIFYFDATNSTAQFIYLFTLGASALCSAVYQHYFLSACFVRIGVAIPVAAAHYLILAIPFHQYQALLIVGIWMSLLWLATRLSSAFLAKLEIITNRDALLKKVASNAQELELLRTTEAQSRQSAEHANLAKSRFLAHSSHDLRQPLHAISLLLETIDEERLDDSTKHVISRVNQSVDVLSNLFDSLLDLTLLDTGQVVASNSVFSIDAMLYEIATDFSSVAIANAVTLKVMHADHFIDADATIVRRMIQNLVANAIRHAPGGEVILRTKAHDGELQIEVEDNGSGIALENQQRIFEEFTKLAEPSEIANKGSLGLGLAIVSRMARLTGKKIGLRSQLGQGSLFFVGPFTTATSEVVQKSSDAFERHGLHEVHIAIIDDDADTLSATGNLLRKWGLIVSLYQHPSLPDFTCPDIIMCDFELGHSINGIQLIEHIRGNFDQSLPALLISGNTSAELSARAKQENLPLLHKPVQPAQLKSALLTLARNTNHSQSSHTDE